MEFFPSISNRQGGGTLGRWQCTLDGGGGTLEAELLEVGSIDAPAWPSGGWRSAQDEGAAESVGRGGGAGNACAARE
ncbi:Os11g0285466 [Oryza sativa Japonica Group]|uniref:Os11g0285466 protein n=1 Tax=Oryza sativa subsp. japonica TaxID=39947 RepID=A0A0P0Y195_ORYSJ|nr:Os11g0285466 [Oryza sativa Japonica Group]